MKFAAILLLALIQYGCADEVADAISKSNSEITQLSSEYVDVSNFAQYIRKANMLSINLTAITTWDEPLRKGELLKNMKYLQTLKNIEKDLEDVQKKYVNALIYPHLIKEKFETITRQRAGCKAPGTYQENAVKAVQTITKCAEESIKDLPKLWQIAHTKINFEKRIEFYTNLLGHCIEKRDQKCLKREFPVFKELLDHFSKYSNTLKARNPSVEFIPREETFIQCAHKAVRPFYINNCGSSI